MDPSYGHYPSRRHHTSERKGTNNARNQVPIDRFYVHPTPTVSGVNPTVTVRRDTNNVHPRAPSANQVYTNASNAGRSNPAPTATRPTISGHGVAFLTTAEPRDTNAVNVHAPTSNNTAHSYTFYPATTSRGTPTAVVPVARRNANTIHTASPSNADGIYVNPSESLPASGRNTTSAEHKYPNASRSYPTSAATSSRPTPAVPEHRKNTAVRKPAFNADNTYAHPAATASGVTQTAAVLPVRRDASKTVHMPIPGASNADGLYAHPFSAASGRNPTTTEHRYPNTSHVPASNGSRSHPAPTATASGDTPAVAELRDTATVHNPTLNAGQYYAYRAATASGAPTAAAQTAGVRRDTKIVHTSGASNADSLYPHAAHRSAAATAHNPTAGEHRGPGATRIPASNADRSYPTPTTTTSGDALDDVNPRDTNTAHTHTFNADQPHIYPNATAYRGTPTAAAPPASIHRDAKTTAHTHGAYNADSLYAHPSVRASGAGSNPTTGWHRLGGHNAARVPDSNTSHPYPPPTATTSGVTLAAAELRDTSTVYAPRPTFDTGNSYLYPAAAASGDADGPRRTNTVHTSTIDPDYHYTYLTATASGDTSNADEPRDANAVPTLPPNIGGVHATPAATTSWSLPTESEPECSDTCEFDEKPGLGHHIGQPPATTKMSIEIVPPSLPRSSSQSPPLHPNPSRIRATDTTDQLASRDPTYNSARLQISVSQWRDGGGRMHITLDL